MINGWIFSGRYWDTVQRLRLTQLYTAPTAIRLLIKHGNEHVDKYDLSSLRTLGSVGEPINVEAWQWYHSVVGKEKCTVVDTWWQTGEFISFFFYLKDSIVLIIKSLQRISKLSPKWIAKRILNIPRESTQGSYRIFSKMWFVHSIMNRFNQFQKRVVFVSVLDLRPQVLKSDQECRWGPCSVFGQLSSTRK